MAINIVLPSLSAGMEDGIIARWLKAEGEQIKKGEVIAEIETDKATMELEAESEGRLGPILVGEGKRAAVNQPIAALLGEDENDAELRVAISVGYVAAVAATSESCAPSTVAIALQAAKRTAASPLARRMARESGIDLAVLNGSGPRGRIVKIDVERARQSQSFARAQDRPAFVNASSSAPVAVPPALALPAGLGEYELIPHSSMRRTIARRLMESKTTIPHFYLSVDCELDALLALRVQVNADREASERISVNDFVVKAAALALQVVADARVIWTDDALLKMKSIDISVAVAIDGGLITPVVRNADRKGIGAISAEIKSLAARARENRLKPEEYQGGSLSVSSLGMYGVRSFSAIVNPPQSCILAIGAAERRPVVRGDDIVPATLMTCTLSVDHRSVDGALGASLLSVFKSAIEKPLQLLV